MGRRTFVAVAAAFVLVLGATGAGCKDTATVQAECLDATVETVSGPQSAGWSAWDPFPAGGTVDARTASWELDLSYPVHLRTGSGPDVCLVGGRVSHTNPHETTSWETWHDSGAGVLVKSAGATIVGTEVHNVGDGFNMGSNDADRFLLQGVRASQVHDDCVQNDYFHSGTIDDSLFDGCYAFLSARKLSATADPIAFDEKVVITRSLVHVEPMPDIYTAGFGPAGHGPVWKMGNGAAGSGISPRIGIHDTIIRIDGDVAAGGNLKVPTVDHDQDPSTPQVSYIDADDCSGNTVVWVGDGPLPYADTWPASCFTFTTDVSVWTDAVAAWEAARP